MCGENWGCVLLQKNPFIPKISLAGKDERLVYCSIWGANKQGSILGNTELGCRMMWEGKGYLSSSLSSPPAYPGVGKKKDDEWELLKIWQTSVSECVFCFGRGLGEEGTYSRHERIFFAHVSCLD